MPRGLLADVGMSYSVRAPFASKMPIRFVPTSVNTSRPLESSREIARGRLPESGTFLRVNEPSSLTRASESEFGCGNQISSLTRHICTAPPASGAEYKCTTTFASVANASERTPSPRTATVSARMSAPFRFLC